jgi:O-methyltransferase involved in polyketide biosynthesis
MTKINFDIHDQVARTLLIPLYHRALESQRPDAMLVDKKAQELVDQIDYPFSQLKLMSHDQTFLAMRVNMFDSICRDFLKKTPNAVIVHIGCGLDTRFERVDNGQVNWIDLDLPEVIALRESLGLKEKERCRIIPSSVFDLGWMENIQLGKKDNVLFLAEGVLCYFTEDQNRSLLMALYNKFNDCEIAFDEMTPMMVRFDNLHLIITRQKARLKWGLKDPKDLEDWAEGIQLLDAMYYFEKYEPRLGSANLMRYIPSFAKSAGVFHYQLGDGK